MNEFEFNLNPNDVMLLGIHLGVGDSNNFNRYELKNHVRNILNNATERPESFLVESLKESASKQVLVLEDNSFAYVLKSTKSGWMPLRLYKRIGEYKRGKYQLKIDFKKA